MAVSLKKPVLVAPETGAGAREKGSRQADWGMGAELSVL